MKLNRPFFRRSELCWRAYRTADVDFESLVIHVRRSVEGHRELCPGFPHHELRILRWPNMARERSGIHLIAEMAKVSIGTVDRALHGRKGIKGSTRQRILQVARQIRYTPNLAARALSVAKASARLGVCMPRCSPQLRLPIA
jgi:hypothetical protein